MATVSLQLPVVSYVPKSGDPFSFEQAGTAERRGYWVDADGNTDALIRTEFLADGYGSGSVTLEGVWTARTATSGDVVLRAQLAAITPDTDTEDTSNPTFGAWASVTDTHLGTTAGRAHNFSIVITDTDSLAAGDTVYLNLQAQCSNASFTMSGEFIVFGVTRVSYSDT